MRLTAPWTAHNRAPPTTKRMRRGRVPIHAFASASSSAAQKEYQFDDSAAQTLPSVNPQPQSSAPKLKDSSQFPITTATSSARIVSTVSRGSPQYAAKSPVQMMRSGGMRMARAASNSACVASRFP